MPSYRDTYPELLKRWQELNIKLSTQYMVLMNDFFSKKEEALCKEIDLMEKDISSNSAFIEHLNLYEGMLTHLCTFDKQLEVMKRKKLWCDINDLKNGHIFSWPKQYNNKEENAHVQFTHTEHKQGSMYELDTFESSTNLVWQEMSQQNLLGTRGVENELENVDDEPEVTPITELSNEDSLSKKKEGYQKGSKEGSGSISSALASTSSSFIGKQQKIQLNLPKQVGPYKRDQSRKCSQSRGRTRNGPVTKSRLNRLGAFFVKAWYEVHSCKIRQCCECSYRFESFTRTLNLKNIFKDSEIPRSVCSNSCLVGYRKNIRRGQPVCCFDCTACSAGEIANQTDMNDCLKCKEDQWPNDQNDKCVPKAIEFLSYSDTLCVLLVAIVIFFCFVTASVLCIFIKYRDTPIVKANNRDLSYLLLLSLMMCFLCSLLFIGHPMRVTCILRQTVFGIIFSVSISSVLAKTIIVVIAFKATNPNSKLGSWVGTKIPYSLILCCMLVQAVICTAWLLTSPPFPEMDVKSSSSQIILECNEGSKTFFYCMLGYMGLLAIVCFAVAFLARTLPDTFNEAKYITFSMLVFSSVWLSFIPAYLSTKGKYMVAVEIFAILSSSAGLLACIFSYKCYIILLQSNLNTKENLVGRGGFSNTEK
ncbi:vomeronasal type-2 receptor 26-like [Protopterus annectens]|uniref:vomeronasal type-2 receptor 26-like n=1 Tax=Protopterus annectens TaxID=7888 RepID=UPI001CFC2A13|nr:vomeronasal type-2 receptor 26-like [Protopterus annectens]